MNLIEAWKTSCSTDQIKRNTGNPPFIFRKNNPSLSILLRQWIFSDDDLLAEDWRVTSIKSSIEERYKTLIQHISEISGKNYYAIFALFGDSLPEEIWEDVRKIAKL